MPVTQEKNHFPPTSLPAAYCPALNQHFDFLLHLKNFRQTSSKTFDMKENIGHVLFQSCFWQIQYWVEKVQETSNNEILIKVWININ